MANNYTVPGNVIEFTPTVAVTSGQVVVIGNLLAIAAGDIAANTAGNAFIDGVFTVPKVTTAVITVGSPLLWDASAAKFDVSTATPATGDVSGGSVVAMQNAGNGTTTVEVKFTGIPGTVA